MSNVIDKGEINDKVTPTIFVVLLIVMGRRMEDM